MTQISVSENEKGTVVIVGTETGRQFLSVIEIKARLEKDGHRVVLVDDSSRLLLSRRINETLLRDQINFSLPLLPEAPKNQPSYRQFLPKNKRRF